MSVASLECLKGRAPRVRFEPIGAAGARFKCVFVPVVFVVALLRSAPVQFSSVQFGSVRFGSVRFGSGLLSARLSRTAATRLDT